MTNDLAARVEGAACRNCAGCEWVCENHRDHPWAGLADVEECCGGAGSPCPVCRLHMVVTPRLYPLIEALKTARDYVSDAALGHLVTADDGKRLSKAMTSEDLLAIDVALARASTEPRHDQE